MKTISRILFSLGLVLALAVANAQATTITLTYGDSFFVGLINDDIPSDPADETGYLKNLITLAPGAPLQQIGSEFYSRVGSTLSPLPSLVTFEQQLETPNSGDLFTVTTSGSYYVLGKYDAFHAGAWVWLIYASAGDVIDLPNAFSPTGQYGLSHTALWSTTQVPEPSTLLLLGGGLLGLGIFARRRMHK